jgi:Fe-S-cluster formation regulator IscX/YfhJ
MAYDYSSVDPTEIEFLDVAGQQCELEIYHDKDAFDRACAEADIQQ